MIVTLYGRLADLCGTNKLELDPVETTFELKFQLEEKFPKLKGQKYILALDKKICNIDEKIFNDSEIVLMPPYSGG